MSPSGFCFRSVTRIVAFSKGRHTKLRGDHSSYSERWENVFIDESGIPDGGGCCKQAITSDVRDNHEWTFQLRLILSNNLGLSVFNFSRKQQKCNESQPMNRVDMIYYLPWSYRWGRDKHKATWFFCVATCAYTLKVWSQGTLCGGKRLNVAASRGFIDVYLV